MRNSIAKYKSILISLLLGLLCIGLVVLSVFHIRLQQSSEAKQAQMTETIEMLEEKLAIVENDKDVLAQAYYSEQQKNRAFQEEIRSIAETVGLLEKLNNTDEELLQKYSKVYFLNEHYMPENLELVAERFVNDDEDEYIHSDVAPYLNELLRSAETNNVPIRIISAFRSFDTQAQLKGQYTVTFGDGANRFSADQGYSEHQLGTTVDFTTPTLGNNFEEFESTDAYTWLTNNAHRYGFTLSYPKGNAFYVFEPWHWRFVGVELATKLFEDEQFFYDLDQREIDEYLVKIFD